MSRALLTFVLNALIDAATVAVMSDEKTSAGGVRARVRAELTAEIKALATKQLETEGASAISLRAISREVGMASSAIYRYFASREELLTALIIDAFNDLGESVESADATYSREDFHGRFVAIAKAVRIWALANPHQYALIYGSPVPGYSAPQDTIDPAIRTPVALISVLVDAKSSGTVRRSKSQLAASLHGLSEFTGNSVAVTELAPAVEAWGEIFGLVSLELFGHFTNAIDNPEHFFGHAVDAMAERVL